MKRSAVCFLIIISILLCFTGCQYKYVPEGEFYVKTPAAHGDTGCDNVISLEAANASYAGEGDITVPFTVGFGHLPNYGGYDEPNTFYALYAVEGADGSVLFEKKIEYADPYSDAKYDSTVPENSSFLIMPVYGEFYPKYKENVEITFPADAEKGVLRVGIYSVIEGHEDQTACKLEAHFERSDGVLTLK